MLPTILEERLQMLLAQAKNPKLKTIAHEQLAAARELIDTAHVLGHLEAVEFRAYHSLCTTAKIIVTTAELARSKDLPKTYMSFSDGIRPTLERPQ